MGEEEIRIENKYLMTEWIINEKTSKVGPKGDKGDHSIKVDTGPRGGTSKEVATKFFVIDMVEGATRLYSEFIASLDNDVKVSNQGLLLDSLKAAKINHIVLMYCIIL